MKKVTPYHDPAEVTIRELGNQAFREFFQDFPADALGVHSLEFCMALHEPWTPFSETNKIKSILHPGAKLFKPFFLLQQKRIIRAYFTLQNYIQVKFFFHIPTHFKKLIFSDWHLWKRASNGSPKSDQLPNRVEKKCIITRNKTNNSLSKM